MRNGSRHMKPASSRLTAPCIERRSGYEMANPLSATQQPYFRGLELIADSKQHENVALLERRLGRRGTHPGIDAPQHRDARTFHVPPESKIQSPFYFVPSSSRISA